MKCAKKQTKLSPWTAWDLCQKDPYYARMLQKMGKLEPKYEYVLKDLPQDKERIVREYVTLCEEMSFRMLQVACSLRFQ